MSVLCDPAENLLLSLESKQNLSSFFSKVMILKQMIKLVAEFL